MANPTVLAQLQQKWANSTPFNKPLETYRQATTLLPQELLLWKLKTPPSPLPTRPSRLKSRTSQEAMRLAALPKVVQEPHPYLPLRQLLQWSIIRI
jgi:hypothetical protein